MVKMILLKFLQIQLNRRSFSFYASVKQGAEIVLSQVNHNSTII
jgi:hypothetical protein